MNKITKQDLANFSYNELRELNQMVIEEIKRKRTIESIEKSMIVNVGDIVRCNIDPQNRRFSVLKIKKVNVVAEEIVTKARFQFPMSTLVIEQSNS